MLNALMHVLLLHLPQRFVGNVHNAVQSMDLLIHQMAHVHPSTSHSAFFISRTRKGIQLAKGLGSARRAAVRLYHQQRLLECW
jgi:hypothetical protein